MLTLNAGLIAIISYTFSQSLYLLTAFRRSDMTALIDENSYLAGVFRSRSSLGPRTERPFQGSSTGDAKMVVCGVGVFWFILMIYGIIAALANWDGVELFFTNFGS